MSPVSTEKAPELRTRRRLWIVAGIIAVVAFMFVHHRAKAFNGVTLTESDFYQKFQSNQIEQAIITYNSANGSETISGKLLQADKNGKTNEVSFVVPNAVLTPTMEDKILPSPRIRINIPNPVTSHIGYQLLFVLFPVEILAVVGFIIFVVWFVFRNGSERRSQGKPDHFWRRFAVVVLLLISIPFVISILGLLAAIAIPNFVRARQHSQELQQQRVVSTSFAIGQTWFPLGDFIEITSVERTEDQMTVKGHYNLVSHDTASLAFNITTTNTTGFPEGEKQSIKISKGTGDFELIHPHLVVGLPHISMYDRHAFASVYFGTKEEAAEESKARWITNSVEQSEPPYLREARAKLAELRVRDGKDNPDLQQALARVNELERMSEEEPNASPELREAKANLAELRIRDGKDNPEVQQAQARVKALEANSVEPSDNTPTIDEQPPVVVETFPVSGARDVDPGETEIRVRFSKDMEDGSWSWSTAWENSTPQFIGSPHYDDNLRTCIARVKLEPGRSYAFWLNSDNFHNFRDADGQSAIPYLLIFQTKPN